MKHFYAYPKIEYSDNLATNIMVRGKVRDAVLQNTSLYYKYTITDSMNAEIISHKYYGSPEYVWAIYYANNIMNPRTDWPMTSREFDKYIVRKYGNIESAHSKYMDDGRINHDAIHHYTLNENFIIDKTTFNQVNAILSKYKTYYLANEEMLKKNLTQITSDGFVIDRQTFLTLGALNPESVQAITFYEYEQNLNEKKRDIVIIDKVFLYDIVSEFETLFD